jgi:hypothetical protein
MILNCLMFEGNGKVWSSVRLESPHLHENLSPANQRFVGLFVNSWREMEPRRQK